MSTEVNLSNVRRKVRSLLAKTAATSGCTPAEKVSAMQMARDIASKHLQSTDVIFSEIEAAEAAAKEATKAKVEAPADKPAKAPKPKAKKADKAPRVKRGDRIIELMSRKEGVSIAELQAEFNSLPHTCRAQISVEARKAGIKPVLKNGRYYKTAPKE